MFNRLKQEKLIITFLFFFLLLFLNSLVRAETACSSKTPGHLKGRLVDQETQHPLVAADIIIEGTPMGAATDVEGCFEMRGIRPGIYTVCFMMTGYKLRVVNNVVINPGKSTIQTIELLPAILKGEGVPVTSEYFQEARDGIVSNLGVDYEQIRSDPGSAEDIQRVVQTLPSVVSGADQHNEIIVRGCRVFVRPSGYNSTFILPVNYLNYGGIQ